MFDIWKSVISGNLTENPALKKSKEGREYVTFSVAVNIEQNLTNYFSIYCFEKRHMDFANAFLKKGAGVVIVGSVQQKKSQSGEKSYLRIVPTDICLKGSTKQPSSGTKEEADNNDEENF